MITVAPPSPSPLDVDTLMTLLEQRFGAGLALSREAPGLLVRVLDLSVLRALSKFLYQRKCSGPLGVRSSQPSFCPPA